MLCSTPRVLSITSAFSLVFLLNKSQMNEMVHEFSLLYV